MLALFLPLLLLLVLVLQLVLLLQCTQNLLHVDAPNVPNRSQ